MRHRLVLNIMTPAQNTVVVHADTPFKEIARRLSDRRISAAPVVDEHNHVVGVVSEADLLYKESRLQPRRASVLAGRHQAREQAREQTKADGVLARDLMTSPAITVGPGDDAARAARLMADRKVRRLPVVDENGRLLGILSRADLLRLFTRPDAEIRLQIRQDVLLRMLWIDPREVDVTVVEGMVRLRGTVETRSLAELVGKVVRHADGVVDVVNELDYTRDDSDDKLPTGPLHGAFTHRRPGT